MPSLKDMTKDTHSISTELQKKAAAIKLLLMDVDGVMTNGLLFYIPGDGDKLFETKGFNAQDGLGLHLCAAASIKTGVISGRDSQALAERAKLLKMTYVYQGLLKKQGAYAEILSDAKVSDDQVAFIGDDLTDLPLLKKVGLACAVANARDEVKEHAHYITHANGGDGAVREVIELILKSQNLWQKALAAFDIS